MSKDILPIHVVHALGELEALASSLEYCILDPAPVSSGQVLKRVRRVSRILKDGMQLSVSGEGVSQ